MIQSDIEDLSKTFDEKCFVQPEDPKPGSSKPAAESSTREFERFWLDDLDILDNIESDDDSLKESEDLNSIMTDFSKFMERAQRRQLNQRIDDDAICDENRNRCPFVPDFYDTPNLEYETTQKQEFKFEEESLFSKFFLMMQLMHPEEIPEPREVTIDEILEELDIDDFHL